MAKSLAAAHKHTHVFRMGWGEKKVSVSSHGLILERGSALLQSRDICACADEFNILSDVHFRAPTLCVQGC
jgi:hypothetical protein